MSNLIKYNQARHALAECRNVDEIKDLRDKSEAMRLYAQQARDKELEQWAAEIKLRAQRAIGKLSAALDKKQGNKGKLPSGGKFKTKVLAEAGISTSTANRYEKLAAIPESEVEEYITHSKVIGKPVSAMAVLGRTKPKPTKANMPMSDVGITKSSVTVAPVADVGNSSSNMIAHHQDLASTGIDQQLTEMRAENDMLRGQIQALLQPTVVLTAEVNQVVRPAGAAGEVDIESDELGQLRTQVAELQASLDKALAENKMMATVLDADDKVKASMEVARAQKAKADDQNRLRFVAGMAIIELKKEVQYLKDRAEMAVAIEGTT